MKQTNFWRDVTCRAVGRRVERRQILLNRATLARSGSISLCHSAPGIERCLLASAWMEPRIDRKGALTTDRRPAAIHVPTIRSRTRSEKTLLLVKRSLRARENAEWSGTLSSIESPQNQR